MTQSEMFPGACRVEVTGKRMSGQAALALEHMKQNGGLTPLEALKRYGISRLAAVVFNLKEAGYSITSRLVDVEKADGTTARVASYSLS